MKTTILKKLAKISILLGTLAMNALTVFANPGSETSLAIEAAGSTNGAGPWPLLFVGALFCLAGGSILVILYRTSSTDR